MLFKNDIFLYIDGKQYLCFLFCFGFWKWPKLSKKIQFFYRDELIKCLAQPTHILIASNVWKQAGDCEDIPTRAT